MKGLFVPLVVLLAACASRSFSTGTTLQDETVRVELSAPPGWMYSPESKDSQLMQGRFLSPSKGPIILVFTGPRPCNFEHCFRSETAEPRRRLEEKVARVDLGTTTNGLPVIYGYNDTKDPSRVSVFVGVRERTVGFGFIADSPEEFRRDFPLFRAFLDRIVVK